MRQHDHLHPRLVVTCRLTSGALALRRPVQQDTAEELQDRVRDIIADVRARGDAALLEYTRRFDGVDLATIEVGTAEFAAAERALNAEQRKALERAIANVRRFHEAQLATTLRVETSPGVVCERHFRAIDAVGLYVPAGVAPLPSAAIMLAVPARIAGCPTRIICTPPRKDGTADPAVLTIAKLCGVRRVFKLGGAQAIAAMAYGTQTMPKVDKVFGPGNAWVDGREALRSRTIPKAPRWICPPDLPKCWSLRTNGAGRVRRSRPAGAGRAQRRCASDAGHDIQRSGGGHRGRDSERRCKASVAIARCANRSSTPPVRGRHRSRRCSRSATRTHPST